MTDVGKHDLDMDVLRRIASLIDTSDIEFYLVVPAGSITAFRPWTIKNKTAIGEYYWPTESAEIKTRLFVFDVKWWTV
jgi:hypothetical protein